MDKSSTKKLKFSDEEILTELKRKFIYSPESGVFTNIKNPQKEIRSKTTNGYLVIRIFKRNYCAHRLAWLWVFGRFPEEDIDHIDCDRLNNRISNLQTASRSDNLSAKKTHNKFGLKGVVRHPNENRVKRYGAFITKHSKRTWLGWHDTAEMAHQAYCDAARRINGKFARDGARAL